MFGRTLFLLSFLAGPVLADVQTVIEGHIEPGYTNLLATTTKLSTAATADCSPDAVRPHFHVAYDAWISISHIQFGPIEDQGLSLAMAFWPDPKDSTGKAIATGLETKADKILMDWPAFVSLMTSAGEPGNARFQSGDEVNRALYTALSTGLEFLHDQRLGRPLGTFERPRPRRAEARRSERSLRHIVLSLEALEALATILSGGDLTKTKAAFAAAIDRAVALEDPALTGVSNPGQRIRIETLQRTVNDIRNAVNDEIGKSLDITAGFNSLDGD